MFPAAHWDWLPTLADLAGAAAPAGVDGFSIRWALSGRPQPAHEFMYWEFHERGFQQAVRTGDWKAVVCQRDSRWVATSEPILPKPGRGCRNQQWLRDRNYLKTARWSLPNGPSVTVLRPRPK
jgi:arylsulfatase A-like enzyme